MKNIFFLFAFLLIAQTSFSQLSPVVDSISMSDGRKLAADIYIPSGMTQGPVILIQTPYNRLLYRFAGIPLGIGQDINSSNYIFVFVDWRGFFGSSSAAYSGNPGRGEDGFDCVEWIAQQSWSNQKVGTWGPSALGRVQYMTAKKNPPHLTCICPLVASPQYEYEEYFPGGVLRTEYVEQLDGLGFGISPVLMMHPVHDIAWTISENANNYPDSIQVPCLMIGGWYDHNINFMLEFFNELLTQSPIAVRDKHKMIVGPWTHSGIGRLNQGELSYPSAFQFSDSLALLFFDYYLRSIGNWQIYPEMQYYQMGEDFWHVDANWNPAPFVNFYLHDDGTLQDFLPANVSGSKTLTYDPADPSPTIGGPTLRVDLEQGPYDQSDSVESRNDILIYETDVLTQDLIMKGKAVVHLKVSSDKTDTDFDIRMTDVYPDGRSMLVNDGTARMRFRNGYTANDTSAIIPGQVYDCTIELPPTAISFLTGHRLRVDITSSNYPRFNRNMNTGVEMYPNGSMDTLVNPEIAVNEIFSNATQVSYVELPLINYQTGVENISNSWNDLVVSPNPMNDKLNIRMRELGEYKFELYNPVGKKLYVRTFDRNSQVDVSDLTKGFYFIRVQDPLRNKNYFQKIIKYDH